LRDRKNAIVKLFDLIGLRPRAGVDAKGADADEKVKEAALKRIGGKPTKKVKEIVGDGEEIEVDDAEVLSNNEITTIYQRHVVLRANATLEGTYRDAEHRRTIVLWPVWNLAKTSL